MAGETFRGGKQVQASNTDAVDRFGISVALSRDTLVVGAEGEGGASGAVYVFRRTGTTWAQEAYQSYLKASNAEGGDRFGISVALSGDTLAVGAVDEDNNATVVDGDQTDNSAPDSGAVYLFQ